MDFNPVTKRITYISPLKAQIAFQTVGPNKCTEDLVCWGFCPRDSCPRRLRWMFKEQCSKETLVKEAFSNEKLALIDLYHFLLEISKYFRHTNKGAYGGLTTT